MNDSLNNALVSADLAEATGATTRLSASQTETLTRARLRLMNGDETAVLAVESLLDLRVTMPVYRLADATKTIARLGKRATKAGLPVPTIEEVSRETREDASEWITVRLLGAAPVLGGWACIATIIPCGEHDPIVCTAADVDALPDDFTDHPGRCQHCNQNRRRNLTFVLRHTDGNIIQVGKTCLNEYLGTEVLATWFVWCELQETAREYNGGGFDYAVHAQWLADNAAAAARRDKTPWKAPDLRSFLAAVAADLRTHEYQRSDRWSGAEGTGFKVLRLMKTAEHEAVTDADMVTADGVIAWLDALVARGANSSYETRLLDFAALAADGVKAKLANTIASAVPVYLRDNVNAAMPERLNEILPGVQPGETIELTVTVERSLGFAQQCADERGRCVLLRGCYFGIGETLRVRGEVNSMTHYRGVRQTILDDVTLA